MRRRVLPPTTVFVVVSFVLLAAAHLFLVTPARGAETSTIIRPNADFAVALWNDPTDGCSTDATRFNELTEDPPDGDVTCRATGTAGDNLQLSLEDPGSPAGIVDIDVFVSLTGRVTGGQTITTSFFSGPGCDLEAEQPVPDITSEVYLTVTAVLERCASTTGTGGIEWTEALLNAMRVSIDCVPTGAGLCFITQAYAEVRYTIQDEPGPPPPPPLPPPIEQVQAAAVSTFRELCNLWLLLLILAVIAVLLIVRRMQRSGDVPR